MAFALALSVDLLKLKLVLKCSKERQMTHDGTVFFLNEVLGSALVPKMVFLCPIRGFAAPAPPG